MEKKQEKKAPASDEKDASKEAPDAAAAGDKSAAKQTNAQKGIISIQRLNSGQHMRYTS